MLAHMPAKMESREGQNLPIERFFRDQRSMMITEGAVEVLRMALARMILNVR